MDFDAHSLRAKKAVLDDKLQQRLDYMRGEWSKREAERERLLEQSSHLIEEVKDIRLRTIDNLDARVLAALEAFDSFMAPTPKELAEFMRAHIDREEIAVIASPELTESRVVQAFGLSNKVYQLSLEHRLCEDQGLSLLHPVFPSPMVNDDEKIERTKEKMASELERAEVIVLSAHGAALDGAIYVDANSQEPLSKASKKKVFVIITVDKLYKSEAEMKDVLKLREVASGFMSKSVKLDPPKNMQLVLFDNGRISLARSAMREMLACISCGSCSLFCPVFRSVGYNYGPPFMGGIGNFMSSRTEGIKNAVSRGLYMCLQCGACKQHCPLGLDVPKAVTETRRRANISKA